MDEMKVLRGMRPPGPNPDAAARARMRERLARQLQATARVGLLHRLPLVSSNRLRVAMVGALTAAVVVGAVVGIQAFVSPPQEVSPVQPGPSNVAGSRDPGEPSTSSPGGGDSRGESASATASPTGGDNDERRAGGGRGVPERDLPRLVELSTHAGNTYSGVHLRFEPGEKRPEASVEESNDPIVRRPGSGNPVRLAGDQALRVTISPAVVGDTEPLMPQGPAIAEVRVLGSFEGYVTVGIGVYGDGNLTPEVSYQEENTLHILIHNATDVSGEPRQCGDVGFEPNTDHGAFDIAALGVSCQVARDVAARAEGQVGESYETPSGFTCLPERDTSGPIPSIRYTCSRGAATITFTAS